MKVFGFFFFVSTFLLVISCSTPSKDEIINRWKIVKVIEGEETIYLKNNWIQFNDSGTFQSFDEATGKSESGDWSYDAGELKLYTGRQEEDSDWILSFENDTLLFAASDKDTYLKAVKEISF